jgi:hypothetical protein
MQRFADYFQRRMTVAEKMTAVFHMNEMPWGLVGHRPHANDTGSCCLPSHFFCLGRTRAYVHSPRPMNRRLSCLLELKVKKSCPAAPAATS